MDLGKPLRLLSMQEGYLKRRTLPQNLTSKPEASTKTLSLPNAPTPKWAHLRLRYWRRPWVFWVRQSANSSPLG